jgi:hypothetical protein
MSKCKSKKSKKGLFSFQLQSDPKHGLVGFMIKRGIVKSKVKAEIFLLAVSVFCFSASFYIINDTFPLV